MGAAGSVIVRDATGQSFGPAPVLRFWIGAAASRSVTDDPANQQIKVGCDMTVYDYSAVPMLQVGYGATPPVGTSAITRTMLFDSRVFRLAQDPGDAGHIQVSLNIADGHTWGVVDDQARTWLGQKQFVTIRGGNATSWTVGGGATGTDGVGSYTRVATTTGSFAISTATATGNFSWGGVVPQHVAFCVNFGNPYIWYSAPSHSPQASLAVSDSDGSTKTGLWWTSPLDGSGNSIWGVWHGGLFHYGGIPTYSGTVP